MRSGIEEALGHGLDLRGCDGVDAGDDLFGGEELVEVHLLPREVGHARVRAFEAHEDVAFELIFGAGEFFVGERSLP